VVRLTKVAGALGMNMNQLVLTLTNQTTMRLDALGVSVDGVDEKVEKLKATGMSASEAFNEAFLQQAEQQMALLGDRAETDAAAFDRMNAAFTNVGDGLKQNLAPALADVAGWLATTITELERLKAATGEQEGEIRATAGSYEDYITQLKKAVEADGMRLALQEDGIHVLKLQTIGYQDLTGEVNVLTQAQWEGIRAAEDWNSTTREGMAAANAANGATIDSAAAVDQLTQARQAEAEAAGNQMSTWYAQTENLREYIGLLDQAAQAKSALTLAEQNYNSVLADFSQSYAQDVVGALQKAGIEGEKYEKALAAVDQQNGTNLLGQYEANEALEAAINQYKRDGDIDKFTDALGANKSEWEALNDNVQQAKSALDEAKASFDALMQDIASWSGKTFTINVETGGGGTGATFKGKKPGVFTKDGMTEMGAASGADFIVPPGYPNDSFRLGVQSGEHVQVTPAGQAQSSNAAGGAVIHIGTIVLPSVVNGQQLVRVRQDQPPG